MVLMFVLVMYAAIASVRSLRAMLLLYAMIQVGRIRIARCISILLFLEIISYE